MVWISIVYAICFLGVAFFPTVREGFMKYALHTQGASLGQNYLSLKTFVSGLIVWNIMALIGVWLFAMLFNKIRQ